tara:strand:- start:759 stop:1091 length:333 start_codon:yes stop_codon:yes gene_type:complete
MERYLYFVKTSDAPDATQEVALYPTSSVTAIEGGSSTSTVVRLVPRDGSGTTEDKITLSHGVNNQKVVMNSLVSLINAQKNKDPFVVAFDAENDIINIEGVTAVSIASAD